MADDTEEMQDNDVPVTDTTTEAETYAQGMPAEGLGVQPALVGNLPIGPTPPAAVATVQSQRMFPAPATPPGVNFTAITSGPRPPTDPRADLYRRQAASNAQLWRNLQSRTAGLPIAQTEAAVAAAMRFQGQRQYQRDLEAGIAPGEALARSAPLMFFAPRQSNLGQAASFIRAATPTRKFHDVGGVLYREEPDGTVKAVTGPAAPKFHTAGGVLYREGEGGALQAATPAPTSKTDPYDLAEYRHLLSEESKAQQELDKLELTDPEAEPLRQRVRFLQGQMQNMRKRTSTGTSIRRVRVRSPEGKTGTLPESQLQQALAAGYTQER